MLVSGSCFCFCFVCFLFQDVVLFLLLFVLFFVVFRIRILDLFLLWIMFSCCFFCFWLPINKYLSKSGYCKKTKMKNAEKTDMFTRAVRTGVLTNRVFFLFCVSLNFACFAESTIKIGVSAKRSNTKNIKNVVFKKNLVQGYVKNWSNYVAQQNWTSF